MPEAGRPTMEENTQTKTQLLVPTEHIDEKVDLAQAEKLFSMLEVKPQERYRFIRSIGFGGMKGVLLVYDRDTQREVAMAIMPDFRERPLIDRLRFVHEAHLTASLEHPNIVPVHDLGLDRNGSPYFTMKCLRGQSLSGVLHKLRREDEETVRRYPLRERLDVFIRVCKAIIFAHSKDVLHLDLKPDNIHLGNFEEVIVLDWGLARRKDFTPDWTGNACGTPGFMAPEQTGDGGKVDERTDIYALGALLYTLLTLQSPLAGRPMEEIVEATRHGRVPPPEKIDPGIPAALSAVCRKAMAPRPADRYASVAELRDDVVAFLNGYAPAAERASLVKRVGLFFLRHFWETLLVFTAMLALILASIVMKS